MQDFEKLGAFYLGRVFDRETGKPKDELVLYDSRDLTTHAVIVGMTGSGKTGLGIGLLEEAAIDSIPAIAIDPKGDLGNLLLTFPELRPADFRPWVDEGEATRAGQTADAAAAATAETWKKGLADWGQDGARIARLRNGAEATIYTPGSTAGRTISVLRSLAAPAVRDDAEANRERIGAAVSGLLALLGVEADPLRSREHILLATLVERAWQAGRDVDLAGLIREIQNPSVERVGVLDLESFFPEKDRFELAMRLNNLLASPGFAAWLEGDPLDVGRLLHTADGRPRLSVLSIAHLSDAERMFFVTLLLGEIVAWMRAQPGTSSLRAILYMDEVFGYLPPTANPPSKTGLLTLLKQARAFGLGVVLATQNPVDLDYKALTNAGTWLVGRLQAERDKARLLDGLEGASAAAGRALDRAKTDTILSALPKRVFLMHDVHEDAPVLLQTRWTLSYLRGPLTREQIRTLSKARAETPPPASAPAPSAPPAAPAPSPSEVARSERPLLPPDVEEVFVGTGAVYRPQLLASARVHYVSAAAGLDAWGTVSLLAELPASGSDIDWGAAEMLAAEPSLASVPAGGATFQPLPGCAARGASYKTWKREVTSHFQAAGALTLWRSPDLKETSRPGESEGDFRARLAHACRERRDDEKEKLRQRFAPRFVALEEQVRQAEQRVEREKSQYGQQKMQTAISVGATVLGALFGRKAASVGSLGRATTAMRAGARAAREREDVGRAQESVEAKQQRLLNLQAEFAAATEALTSLPDATSLQLETVNVPPRKGDLSVKRVALAWVAG